MIEYRESAEPECPGMSFTTYKDIVAKYAPGIDLKKLGIVGWAITPLPVYMSLKNQFPDLELVKADETFLKIFFFYISSKTGALNQ
jgi:hypothetical protein